MLKRKILFFMEFCLLLGLDFFAFSEEKSIVLGGKNGWPQLSYEKGITTGSGRFGYTSIELETNARKVTEYTDLLLNFDDNIPHDSAGKYEIKHNSLMLTPFARMGKGAAVSTGHSKGLILKGEDGTLFGSSGLTGSFTIEFWLSPSIAENGEVILSWRSSRNQNDTVLYQTLSASFFNNHLEWKFINVFDGYTKDNGEINLTSYRTIVPDRWAHHVLSYDDYTGLLEYRIDGQIEDLKYITESGHEADGSIYPVNLGVVADFEICPLYTGSIDDFRIVRTNIEGESSSPVIAHSQKPSNENLSSRHYDTYEQGCGRIESETMLVNPGSVLKSIDAIMDLPPETAIQLYVRSGDSQFGWNSSYPQWLPVSVGEEIEGVVGKYFQIAAELYPDGAGQRTPSITQLTVNYSETALPLPPFKVAAVSQDGCVTLTWSHSLDDSVGGYYIYYGERPSEYMGSCAAEGVSPLDVGNVSTYTINGLSNGTVYYFSIATYSSLDESIIGALSQEVSARPLPKRKK